ncbi:hypothetical protein [Bacillus sp. 1P06AnD]|uniref:hypothetical protein n=1 Tax=Bacillus sp. 1P06AnD TaxID=3132208 RepID=UPI0039A113B4
MSPIDFEIQFLIKTKVEIHINIAMVDVNITMNNHNLCEREIKIIEVLFLNLCAQTNALVTKGGMALNPLEISKKDSIFNYRFAWQSSISPRQYGEIEEGIKEQISNAIKMCGLPEVGIGFKENAYLSK